MRLSKGIQMSASSNRTLVTGLLAVLLILGAIYLIDPTFGGLRYTRYGMEYFNDMKVVNGPTSTGDAPPGVSGGSDSDVESVTGNPHAKNKGGKSESFRDVSDNEGFSDLAGFEGPSEFGNSQAPAGCYPRDQLTPGELLPKDPNSTWAQQNPMGNGSLKGKNFLSAGALIGVNTVGQSLRNGNYQFRSEPPNPQMPVSIWNQSTIEPDVNRRTLEVA